MKINKVLDLALSGNKAKLSKYLNKGIFSKKDKRKTVKMIPLEGGGSSIDEEYLLYYQRNTGDNPYFLVDLNTKEIVEIVGTTISGEDYLKNLYSIDNDTISIRPYDLNSSNEGSIYYGLKLKKRIEVIMDGVKTNGLVGPEVIFYPNGELRITQIGKWKFKIME